MIETVSMTDLDRLIDALRGLEISLDMADDVTVGRLGKFLDQVSDEIRAARRIAVRIQEMEAQR